MNKLDRRHFVAGTAITGAATALAGSGTISATAQAASLDAMKLGAKANGKDDDWPILQSAFSRMSATQVISLPPGQYHLSKPVEFLADYGVLLGFGAVLDNTIVVKSMHTRLLGLRVYGSPGAGFQFFRGQGGHFEALSAERNGGAGFLIGGQDGSQVAWAGFLGCSSLANAGNGWHLDAAHQRSWINANTFVGCWSRGNQGMGWFSEGRANYNTWTGCEAEDNCHAMPDKPPIWLQGLDNFFYGGHVADTLSSGNAMRLGKGSMVFGGRFIGTVDGADFVQAAVVTSRTRKRTVDDPSPDDDR